MGLIAYARGKGSGGKREVFFDWAGNKLERFPVIGSPYNNMLNWVEQKDIEHPVATPIGLIALDGIVNNFETTESWFNLWMNIDDPNSYARVIEENPFNEWPGNAGDMALTWTSGFAEATQDFFNLEEPPLDAGYVITEIFERSIEVASWPFEFFSDPVEVVASMWDNTATLEVGGFRTDEIPYHPPTGHQEEIYDQDLGSYLQSLASHIPHVSFEANNSGAVEPETPTKTWEGQESTEIGDSSDSTPTTEVKTTIDSFGMEQVEEILSDPEDYGADVRAFKDMLDTYGIPIEAENFPKVLEAYEVEVNGEKERYIGLHGWSKSEVTEQGLRFGQYGLETDEWRELADKLGKTKHN